MTRFASPHVRWMFPALALFLAFAPSRADYLHESTPVLEQQAKAFRDRIAQLDGQQGRDLGDTIRKFQARKNELTRRKNALDQLKSFNFRKGLEQAHVEDAIRKLKEDQSWIDDQLKLLTSQLVALAQRKKDAEKELNVINAILQQRRVDPNRYAVVLTGGYASFGVFTSHNDADHFRLWLGARKDIFSEVSRPIYQNDRAWMVQYRVLREVQVGPPLETRLEAERKLDVMQRQGLRGRIDPVAK